MEIPFNALQALFSPDPAVLQVCSATCRETQIVVNLAATVRSRSCPSCYQPSGRIHPHYSRRLTDLPIRRVPVRLQVRARRFFCRNKQCRRRVFAERLGEVAKVAARRTQRLRLSLRDIGLADGGERGARLARRLGMRTSPDSLLRLTRDRKEPDGPKPQVIGVDEWAKRKGQTCATIVVDLERRRVADLLEDATAEGFAALLKAHPGAEVISRDQGGVLADGEREGAPAAVQVADRFHLVKNPGETIEEYLGRIRRHLPFKPSSAKDTASPPGPETSCKPSPESPRL